MRRKSRRKEIPLVELNITALLDMFTMLLIFLLINYSAASYTNIRASGYLSFPKSISEKKMVDMLTIVVDRYNILIDGKLILKHKNGVIDPSELEGDYKIIPLYNALLRSSQKTQYIASQNDKIESQGKIVLQMDKDMPFYLLRQIMYTAGQAEYNDFKFIALKK